MEEYMEFVKAIAGFAFSCMAFAFAPFVVDAGTDVPAQHGSGSTDRHIVAVLARADLPDLAIQNVDSGPRPASLNTTVTITTVIVNNGPAAVAAFNVTWSAVPLWQPGLGALYGGNWAVAGLPAGNSITLTATQVVTQPGALRLLVTADPLDLISETTKSNNSGQGEIGVLGTVQYCGNISGDATWAYAVFVPTCDLTIQSGATLTVSNGAVVKPMSGVGIFINGWMNAVGDATSPVVFTSYRNDSYGGDTNNDGSGSHPVAGDWLAIHIYAGGAATIDYARIRYGGGYRYLYTQNVVRNEGGTLHLTYATVEFGAGLGIYVTSGSTLTVQDSIIQGNAGNGIDFTQTSGVTAPTIRNTAFISNVGYAA